MPWIPFEWWKFAFKCFESISIGLNLHSSASNPSGIVRICNGMLRIPFDWLQFALECLGWLSMVTFWIWMHRILFEWLKFRFQCCESLLSSNFRMLRILFKWFEFSIESLLNGSNLLFECFESLSNCSNLDLNTSNSSLEFGFMNASNPLSLILRSNASNILGMVWILLQILFEWLEFAFKCFEWFSSDSNLHSNASNLIWRVRICIRMLWVWFEWLQFAFECFDPFRVVRTYIRKLRIPFEWLEFPFECFITLSNGLKLHSNASNPFRICNQIQFALKCFEPRLKVWIWIPMLQIPFEWLEFVVERFKTLSNGSNLHSNALNPFGMVTICIRMLRIPFQMNRTWIRMLRIPFEWLEFALEFFEFLLNG